MRKNNSTLKSITLIMLFFFISAGQIFAADCGDVNSNGSTDIVDALLIAKAYVGVGEKLSKDVADVNRDNTINIVDALLIAQLYVGVITELTGCAAPQLTTPPPTGGGPTIDPKMGEVIGWGAGTVGGAGGKEITVTNINDLISAAASEGPMIINVKGNLVHNVSGGGDDARIWIASHKTIQGVGNASVDACFTNARERESCTQIILRNLRLSNPTGKGTGDAVEFTNGATYIWVDHCTFGQCKDGALDFKRGCNFATVSWCKFAYTSSTHGHNYPNLVGHSDKYPQLDQGKLKVTFHHNWWAENVIERMPRVRYGQVHVFNNYYSSNRTNYNIGVGVEAQILVEANYFENQNGSNGTWFDWYPANKCTHDCAKGKIQWTSDNVFENTKVSSWAPNSKVFTPPYKYKHVLQSSADAKASVMKYAGVLK